VLSVDYTANLSRYYSVNGNFYFSLSLSQLYLDITRPHWWGRPTATPEPALQHYRSQCHLTLR